jgi:hypothetical protein
VAGGEDGEIVETMECLVTAGVIYSTSYVYVGIDGVMLKVRHLNT